MGQVSVRINGFVYVVGCADGEEAHLQAMALQVEKRVERVRTLGSRSGGEGRMLALAALLMADEIFDLSREKLPSGATQTLARAEQALIENERRKDQLSLLVERAESIAASLEQD